MQTFRIALKAARENNGLSVAEAARRIGVSRKTLCAWEEHPDVVSVYYYKRIAETYHLPIDVIFFWQLNRIKFYNRRMSLFAGVVCQ